MAKNTGNNRIPIKWVRDKAKAAYEKKGCCYICGSTVDLELHHLHSLTILLEGWAARKQYDISTDDGILEVRDEFISEHYTEIYEMVYTLCNRHHVALHSVYGKAPAPTSVDRQRRWIDLQKSKIENTIVDTTTHIKETNSTSLGIFSRFYIKQG